MSCMFEKAFINICEHYDIKRDYAETLFLNRSFLVSPTDFLYKLVQNKIPLSTDKKHSRDIIEYSMRSCYGYNVYDRCDFFFYMANKFAQVSTKNVFIIQFDIKSCFKLAKIIPSENIFKIHNFILEQALEFLKKHCDFAYAFDATRNDDSYFVVGGNITQDKINTILSELQSVLHNSIIRDIKNDELYKEKPIVTYGFAELGQNISIKKALTNIEKMHKQTNTVGKTPYYLQKNIYDYQSHYIYDNPYTNSEPSALQSIYFMPDDYSGANKERLLIEKIKHKQNTGIFVHFKFQNSSGVNKLMTSKEFGILILQDYINILKKMLQQEEISNDIYFVGLNSFVLHLHNIETVENITNFFNRFNDNIDKYINSRFINEYFSLTGSECIDDNLKISDIPSKRGLSSGISTINYLYTLSKNIKSIEDFIKFKNTALRINQTNIRTKCIESV